MVTYDWQSQRHPNVVQLARLMGTGTTGEPTSVDHMGRGSLGCEIKFNKLITYDDVEPTYLGFAIARRLPLWD